MESKLLFFTFLIFGLFSCEQAYTPKPRGYFRIDLPEKQYSSFDTSFPYSFDYPVYSTITGDPHSPDEKYWINLNFPEFKATVHISYKEIDGNLVTYLEDAHTLVTKHIAKADAISDSLIIDPNRNLFGLAYTLEGSGAASPYQFFLTDSSTSFIRGALYFNIVPNNDSLEPVINFIKKDIVHLFTTFQWKELKNN
ncbi:MAG TPA: gliding motility lipoprotein GldD [Bacteroidales bacterium]